MILTATHLKSGAGRYPLVVLCGVLLLHAELHPAASAEALNESIQIMTGIDNARLVVEEDFENPDWRDRWVLEGDATVAVEGGKINIMTGDAADGVAAATLWLKGLTHPADVLIEYRAGSTPGAGLNAANLNLITHCTEADGSPYRFGRSGRYAEYHEIPNYIFTFTGGFQKGWSRVRRNPGFELLSDDPDLRSEVGASHHFMILKLNGRIRQWIDGELVHDVNDADPNPGGALGLRTWTSNVWWGDLRVWEPAAAAGALVPRRRE